MFIAKAAIEENRHLTRISSGTANSLLGFASLHILANNYQPLKWALSARTELEYFLC
jgi:hypothetical protein